MLKLKNISISRDSEVDRMRSNDNPFMTYKPSEICNTTLSFIMKEGFNLTLLIDKISAHKDVLHIDFNVTYNSRHDECNDCSHELEINIQSKSPFVTSVEYLTNDNLLKQ